MSNLSIHMPLSQAMEARLPYRILAELEGKGEDDLDSFLQSCRVGNVVDRAGRLVDEVLIVNGVIRQLRETKGESSSVYLGNAEMGGLSNVVPGASGNKVSMLVCMCRIYYRNILECTLCSQDEDSSKKVGSSKNAGASGSAVSMFGNLFMYSISKYVSMNRNMLECILCLQAQDLSKKDISSKVGSDLPNTERPKGKVGKLTYVYFD